MRQLVQRLVRKSVGIHMIEKLASVETASKQYMLMKQDLSTVAGDFNVSPSMPTTPCPTTHPSAAELAAGVPPYHHLNSNVNRS